MKPDSTYQPHVCSMVALALAQPLQLQHALVLRNGCDGDVVISQEADVDLVLGLLLHS